MQYVIDLTREVRFALPLDRDKPDSAVFVEEPIDNGWSGWPALSGRRQFLSLRCSIRGVPDPTSGYICNIKIIDRTIREAVLSQLIRSKIEDGASATDTTSNASDHYLDSLLRAAWEILHEHLPKPLRVVGLQLSPSPYLRYSMTHDKPAVVRVTQQYEFSAAHRLHNPELSEEDNLALFGKCNNPNGHGHNYVVEVSVDVPGMTHTGPSPQQPSPQKDARFSLLILDQQVRRLVIDRLDHKHLNLDVPEFQSIIPSVENIAAVVWKWLDGKVCGQLGNVRVYETPKTWADCAGQQGPTP